MTITVTLGASSPGRGESRGHRARGAGSRPATDSVGRRSARGAHRARDRGSSWLGQPCRPRRSGAGRPRPLGIRSPSRAARGSALIYVDSSALVKLVIEEPESAPLRDFLAGDPDQVASAIVEVEVVRAVRRVAPDLTRKAEEVVRRLSVIDVAEPIRARAALLAPAAVRSLDALHLATAIEVGAALDAVITYDAWIAAAARSCGLAVTAPA